MNREFYLTHTVRYDECNCDGVLTPAAFLRYMQEIASRDAEDVRLRIRGTPDPRASKRTTGMGAYALGLR